MVTVVLEVVLSGAGLRDMGHDKIDDWDAGIEKHVGNTPLAPSSHFKIAEHHRHNLHRCCS